MKQVYIVPQQQLNKKKGNGNPIFNAQSYYIFLYAICFSTIKCCNYWNYQTENAIVEHAIEQFDETFNESELSTDLPETIQICGSTTEVVYTSRHEGTLCCTSVVSKVALAELIFANTVHNTGFFIWLENCLYKMSVKRSTRRRSIFY